MTPTLQASDLDIPQEVWDAATTHEMDEAVRSFGKPSVALACARAILAERQSLSAQLAAEKARADKLRRALIEAGTAAGGYLSDEVSDEFLTRVPYEVKARIAATEANLAAANKQIEEMRGALKSLADQAEHTALGIAAKRNTEAAGHRLLERAAEARTALSHEARNGTDTGAGDA